SLDSAHQLAIKVASAIGRTFDVDLLLAVYPHAIDAAQLDHLFRELVRTGLVERAGPRGRYAFRHVIIQDETHGMIADEKLAPLHRHIASALEARHRDNLEPHYAELADHLERAHDAVAAIAYRLRAARVALARFANHDALGQ